MALDNKHFVGVLENGGAILVPKIGSLSLSDAANLYAYLRLFLEMSHEGAVLAEKAWHDVNE